MMPVIEMHLRTNKQAIKQRACLEPDATKTRVLGQQQNTHAQKSNTQTETIIRQPIPTPPMEQKKPFQNTHGGGYG